MKKTVSDYIADFLAEKEIRHVFGIIGAGNVRLFESIANRGYTQIVCVHHEQAACMAMQTYYRITGKITASLLTTGAGSTNGVTGVVGAWADSIPGIVISGNENSKFTTPNNPLRMWGVQGYDSSDMVRKVCKHVGRLTKAEDIGQELTDVFRIADSGRKGPCWFDIPMDYQSMVIDVQAMKSKIKIIEEEKPTANLESHVEAALALLKDAKRPVLWLGHGIRLAKAQSLIQPFIEKLNIPTLVSWAGIDMIDSEHELVFGRAGIYGQRCSNFVLQNSDLVLAIGTRLALPQIGYDVKELVRSGKIIHVDIDKDELDKLSERTALRIWADAKDFMNHFSQALQASATEYDFSEWVKHCQDLKIKYPVVETKIDHPDTNSFINSYRFMEKLNGHFKSNQIVVTDMGTALLCGHQVLKLKGNQRLMTSTGLGEMGYGLPAAIGASFATDHGEVLCLNCDGGMMMNLQELQTIAHHQLPIKIIVFNNDGYLMIKHTQKALFGVSKIGIDKASGVSCPDFSKLATAFGFASFQIRTWDDVDQILPQFQAYQGPVICEVFMDPQQLFVPKLSLAQGPNGTLISPPLEDLFPFIPREQLKKEMEFAGMHEKSKGINA